jgi:hypothetical protein
VVIAGTCNALRFAVGTADSAPPSMLTNWLQPVSGDFAAADMLSQPFRVVLTTNHPRTQCVDLCATFGRRFRYHMDEAYDIERPEFRAREAAWLTVIPCRDGRIYPHGDRRLAASCPAGAKRRRMLESLPGVTVVQGGGPGSKDVTVTFDAADIGPVAALLGARHPRTISAGERRRLQELGRAWRFGTPRPATTVDFEGQEPRSLAIEAWEQGAEVRTRCEG